MKKITLTKLNLAYDSLTWRMNDCHSCVFLHEKRYARDNLSQKIDELQALINQPLNKRAQQEKSNAIELLNSAVMLLNRLDKDIKTEQAGKNPVIDRSHLCIVH